MTNRLKLLILVLKDKWRSSPGCPSHSSILSTWKKLLIFSILWTSNFWTPPKWPIDKNTPKMSWNDFMLNLQSLSNNKLILDKFWTMITIYCGRQKIEFCGKTEIISIMLPPRLHMNMPNKPSWKLLSKALNILLHSKSRLQEFGSKQLKNQDKSSLTEECFSLGKERRLNPTLKKNELHIKDLSTLIPTPLLVHLRVIELIIMLTPL